MQSQCGAGRRRSKKGGRRTRRRGGGYGFNMDAPIGVGAASVTPNNTSDVGKPLTGQTAAARRRSKKTKKGGRRRRSTRGGGSIATVGYGYTGTGSRGLADATGYVANPPGPVGYMGHNS